MRPGRAAGAFASPRHLAAMLPIDEPALSAELIRSRHDALLTRLRAAAGAAGRDPDGVRLVAVTKGFEAGVIREAMAAGLRRFGETRVQEAIPKMTAAPAGQQGAAGGASIRRDPFGRLA